MEQAKRVVALGFFDGVHLGHGALLSLCAQRAKELGAIPAAFTFDLHPSALIPGKEPIPLLTTPSDRTGLMKRCYGIQEVAVAHYDQRMMTTPWRDFVTEFLVKELGAVHLVAGHGFPFGYKGEGDPERLKQVFCNVLDNAAKHGGAGRRIMASIDQEGSVQVVRVRDYGPGIPEEELPFVKQKFYKGTSRARGSGIGLAVCDEIIGLHGGTFTIGNADGGGAVVTIKLPIRA